MLSFWKTIQALLIVLTDTRSQAVNGNQNVLNLRYWRGAKIRKQTTFQWSLLAFEGSQSRTSCAISQLQIAIGRIFPSRRRDAGSNVSDEILRFGAKTSVVYLQSEGACFKSDSAFDCWALLREKSLKKIKDSEFNYIYFFYCIFSFICFKFCFLYYRLIIYVVK